jgi:hypothetical protein
MGLFKKASAENTNSTQRTKRDTNATGTGSGSSDFSRGVVMPEGWQDDYNAMGDRFINNDGSGAQAARDQLGRINETYNPYYANENSFTLNGMIDNYGYKAPQDVTSQNVSADQIAAQQVAAQQGLNFSKGYENRFTDNVVDRTLNNYDVGTERSANAFRANSIAGGQGGNARQGVAAGVLGGEAARGRADAEAGLRFGAQDRAFGLGMGDADRNLQGQGMNQQANLNAAQSNQQANLNAQQYNSGQDMTAQQYNAGRLDQRQMFDANMAEQGTRRRMDAVNNMEQNVLAQGMLGNDQFNQGMQYLNQGTAMFGEQGTSAEQTQFDERTLTDEEIKAKELRLKIEAGAGI